MLEDIVVKIKDFSPLAIYFTLFFFSYFENVFPPSPSDMVVIVGGTLIGAGVIYFIPTLVLTTIGSVLGFMSLYWIGSRFDSKVIRKKKFKYISLEGIDKVEEWFAKYGNWIIITNRFIPGTRSVVGLFVGMAKIDWKLTAFFSFLSALLWNAGILFLGIEFGKNIELVDKWLNTYSNIAIGITIVVALFFIVKYFIKKKTKAKKEADEKNL